LRTSQFLILCAIAESEEIAHCELARRFFAAEATLSRRLASARKAGWVEMNVDAQRRRVYRLTEAGQALLRSAVPNWERAQERLRSQLDEKDWDALVALTERVTWAAAAAENAPFRNSRPVLTQDHAAWSLDIQGIQPGCFPISQSAAD
jgi:DNA-binding MarR family transcriptional regulator